MKMRTKIYVFLFVLVLGVVFWMTRDSGTEVPSFEAVKVERGQVYNDVSVTGHVEPTTRMTLAFSTGGRLEHLAIEEGTQVEKNTLIAALDTNTSEYAVQEAEARLAGEQAKLKELLAPLRYEEKALKDESVIQTERALVQAQETSRAALERAFVYADDAIHEKADELFELKSSNPELGVTFTYGTTKYYLNADEGTKLDLSTKRREIETLLVNMKARATDATITVDEALLATGRDLLYIEDFLTTLAKVINDYAASDTYDQTVYETFQTSITGARTAVSTVRGEVLTSHSALLSAESSLSLALRDLELSVAGVSDETISVQEAMVAAARAGLEKMTKQLGDTVLHAPRSGVVSKVFFESGEMVSPYEPIAELITEGTFEVEAYIPEADIARVKLGDSCEITFDAFEQGDVFTAEVVRIALSETIRDGVPTYKTTLRLTDTEIEDVQIRPGMTADIEIRTDLREDVLFVPIRSVLRKGTQSYVRTFSDGTFSEKNIEIGLRGSEGTIEVTSGLREGDEIVLYVEEA